MKILRIFTLSAITLIVITHYSVRAYVSSKETIQDRNSQLFDILSTEILGLEKQIEEKKKLMDELHLENKKLNGETAIEFPTGYNEPDDLELVFLKGIGLDYSQNQNQHVKRNGYVAFDIVDKAEDHAKLYAPSYMYLDENGIMQDEEREYTYSTKIQEDTTGLTIVLKWNENGKEMEWNIGHVYELSENLIQGTTVKTGDIIGLQGGCKDSLQYGEKSTGCHAHIELRQGGVPIYYPIQKSLHGEALKRAKLHREFKNDYEKRLTTGNYDPVDYNKYKHGKILQVIHSLENGQQTKNCKTSYKGARGCMQFMKGTWEGKACDGDGDGIAHPNNTADALCSASKQVEHLYNLYTTKHPNAEEEHIVFKVLYSYNAGYQLKNGSAIRKNNNISPRADNGITIAVKYGLDGLVIYNSI